MCLRFSLNSTVLSGMCKNCTYHFFVQFIVGKDIFYVSGNTATVDSVNCRHRLFRCPQIAVLEGNINGISALLAHKGEKLNGAVFYT